MSGGLVQIVTYGAQDLFLTSSPQITFFKLVYRRYTNFGISQIEIPFEGYVNFDELVSVTLPKNGDLVHKSTLKIELPQINISNPLPNDIDNQIIFLQNQRDIIQTQYNNYTIYSKIIIDAVNLIKQQLTINFITSNEISITINKYFASQIDIETYSQVKNNIENRENIHKTDIQSFVNFIINQNIEDDEKLLLLQQMNNNVNNSITFFHNQYQKDLINANKNLNQTIQKKNNNLINFAWIDRLGHFIMEYVEIRIADTKIDRHYGQWMNVWYELSRNIHLEETYFKLIGNIPELTEYNSKIKPTFSLYVPLNFWFCQNNGLALPLISLRYCDVTINVQLRKLSEICFHDYQGNDLENLITIQNMTLIADYIYLDREERRKFANSSHEYLIEQIQQEVHESTTLHDYFDMDFEHPCKEIFWISQSKDSIESNFYNIYNHDDKNPTESSILEFNGTERFSKQSGMYFNILHPYEYHSTTPSNGINIYSFSLYPEEHQPSGSVNMSMLKSKKMFITFRNEFFDEIISNNDIIITTIYVKNYNILRFAGGYGGLAFTI